MVIRTWKWKGVILFFFLLAQDVLGCNISPVPGFQPQDESLVYLCYAVSKEDGSFSFYSLPSGGYTVVSEADSLRQCLGPSDIGGVFVVWVLQESMLGLWFLERSVEWLLEMRLQRLRKSCRKCIPSSFTVSDRRSHCSFSLGLPGTPCHFGLLDRLLVLVVNHVIG